MTNSRSKGVTEKRKDIFSFNLSIKYGASIEPVEKSSHFFVAWNVNFEFRGICL